MEGPYTLTEKEVDRVVARKSPGAYILDRKKLPEQTFYVYYAGRSDVDVNARLKQHLGNYSRFKFEYHSSPKSAFEKECNLYHDFNPPDNSVHPARPANSGWKCPRCTAFD